MTKKDVSELFSIVMTAWPHAEMCKATVDDLDRMISLWQVCLNDIDFWTAQQALIRLCQKLKFAPTIADLRAEAEAVRGEVEATARFHWDMYCMIGEEEYIAVFNNPSFGAAVKALTAADDWYQFREAYFALVQGNHALLESTTKNQRRLT